MNRLMQCKSKLAGVRTSVRPLMSCCVFLCAMTFVHAQAPTDWREAFAKIRPSIVTVIVSPPKSEGGNPLSSTQPNAATVANGNVAEVLVPITIANSERAELRRALIDASNQFPVEKDAGGIWRLLYNANAANGNGPVALVDLEKRPNAIVGLVVTSDGGVVAITGNEPVGGVQVMLPSGELVDGKVSLFDELTGASFIAIGRSAESCGLKPMEISDKPLEIGLPIGAAWTRVGGKDMVAGVGIIASDEMLLGTDAVPVVETDIATRNSANGGVIVNSQGQCIGVINRMTNQFGDLGNTYAIPVSVIKPLIENAHNSEKRSLHRGRIGVQFGETTNHVTAILPDSSAQKAGLLPGDRIVQVRSKEVTGGRDAILELSRLRSGDTASFVVDRDGTKLTFELELGASKDSNKASESATPESSTKGASDVKPSEGPAASGSSSQANRGQNPGSATQPAAPITGSVENRDLFYQRLKVERTNIEESMQKLMSEITKLREELKAIRDTKK